MKKVILILQRVISVFKIQDNQRTTLNSVCWVFDQRSLIFEKTFKKPTSLISFQQLDLNRHDLWNMRFDSRTRKIFKQEHRLSLKNPWQKWHQHFSTLLETLTTWGNTVDLEKENKQYSNQLGAMKDDQMMNQWTEDNVVQRKINRTSIQMITGGNVVQR